MIMIVIKYKGYGVSIHDTKSVHTQQIKAKEQSFIAVLYLKVTVRTSTQNTYSHFTTSSRQ